MKALALLALLFVTSCANTEPLPEAPHWIVGSDLDNLPFAGVDENGRPVGRDVEMMERIAVRSGATIEWMRMPFDELLDAVRAGDIDIVCATLGITEERERTVDFSEPYFETAIAVVVRSGGGSPSKLSELARKKVGAGVGTTSELAVRNKLTSSRGVFENKSGAPTLERLLNGELDAAVLDAPAADSLIEASAGRLSRLPEDLDAERYALVVGKGEQPLLRTLDAALRAMRADGTLSELDSRHGLKEVR